MLYWGLVCVKAILLYSESIWVKDIMLYSVPKSVPAFVRPGFDNKQTWNERNEFSLCKHYIRITLLCHPGGKPRRRIYKQKKNEFKSWTEPVKLYYRKIVCCWVLGAPSESIFWQISSWPIFLRWVLLLPTTTYPRNIYKQYVLTFVKRHCLFGMQDRI